MTSYKMTSYNNDKKQAAANEDREVEQKHECHYHWPYLYFYRYLYIYIILLVNYLLTFPSLSVALRDLQGWHDLLVPKVLTVDRR